MSSRSHSSSSGSKRKRDEKEDEQKRHRRDDRERDHKKHRSRSRSPKRHRSSSKERKHSSSHSSRSDKDKHRHHDEKKDRSHRSDKDKDKHRYEEKKREDGDKSDTMVKKENATPQPVTALKPVKQESLTLAPIMKQEGEGKKPTIDVSSLLSNIKATRAALQQTQKSFQQKTEQKQVESAQKRVVEQKQKDSKDASEKWKSIEEIQSKINEKLAHMRVLGKAPTPTISVPGGKSVLPPPLLLDAEGREIDQSGRVISTGPKALVATTMINKRVQREKVFKLEKPTFETDPTKNHYFDPRMSLPKASRQRRGFKFVEAGTYVKKGARMRTKLAKQILSNTSAAIAEQGGEGGAGLGMNDEADRMALDSNLVNLGMLKKAEEIIKEEEPIPDVEWWDMPILVEKTKYGDVGLKRRLPKEGEEKEAENNNAEGLNVKDGAITHLIEHPYMLHPPSEKPPPGPMPLKLTKAEQKKMRRRARAERLREQQERVLLGLEKPPANRVRLSNMMKVLGTEAVQDPTQIEHMVRAEMEQRVRNHEARNEARKLTPAQKRLKKLRKLKEDTTYLSRVAVFKVLNLADEKHRYKVDVNAQENNLTGRAVMFGTCNLILVEGGPKAILRYKKLLLRRVDWNSYVAQEGEAGEGEEGDAMETDGKENGGSGGAAKAEPKPAPFSNNQCWLVWEGSVLKPAFKDFRFEQVFSEKAARKLLKDRRVAHYWDVCRYSKLSDAVHVEL